MSSWPIVIVTRPAAQAGPWVQALQALGMAAQALPLIHIGPGPDRDAVANAVKRLASQALVVFVSPNAVDAFVAELRAPWPAGVIAATTGPGTAQALRAAGVPPAQIVEPAADAPQFDSEALWAQVGERDWRGREVLIVRGNGGRDWLAERFRGAGAQVQRISAYERQPPPWNAEQRAVLAAALAEPERHRWLFSSSEAIGHLRAHQPSGWQASAALATHPRIAEAARALGFGRVDAVRPDPASVAASLQSRPS